MAKNTLGTVITRTSFLLVLLITLIILYAQTLQPSALFPQNHELWNRVLTVYLLSFALVLILGFIFAQDVIRNLATATYWKAFVFSFLPNALVTFLTLFLLRGFIKGTESLDIFSTIAYMPLSVLLVHLFVVTQVEEIIFHGIIYQSVKRSSGEGSARTIELLLFSIWHFAKTGGSFIAMMTYIPLRLWWSYISEHGTPVLRDVAPRFFGPTPKTQQGGAGAHFGWNLFVIGIGGS